MSKIKFFIAQKKPIPVLCFRLSEDNIKEAREYLRRSIDAEILPDGLLIKTMEGNMKADFGDFIIGYGRGEFYPCKSKKFLQSYDEI